MNSGLGESPCVSTQELLRARERVTQVRWQPAAEALRSRAEQILSEDVVLPEFDSSWYDAEPDRAFDKTYREWHDYIRPATRLARRIGLLLRAGMVFDWPDCLHQALGWALHLAELLPCHVQHHDAGMEYGRLAEPLAETLAVLRPQLSDADQQRMARFLTELGEAIRTSNAHWLQHLAHMPYNNHFTAHRRALLCLGLVLDRSEWVQEALCGPRGFEEMLVGATLDDGLCYESSTLYHYATVGFLMDMAELVRHAPGLGRDLHEESFANGRRLKQMLDAPLGLLLPTGELPALGDCYASRRPLWARHAGLYERAYAVYGDPRYAWLLRKAGERRSLDALLFGADELDAARAPGGRSRTWTEHGYALVTSSDEGGYWDGRGFTAVLTGDRSGVHNHRDTLSLQVAAAGRVWLEDVESRAMEAHGFSAPIQAGFNRTMLAHNLVVVDGQDQPVLEKTLPLVEFRDLADCRTVTMADLEGRLAEGVQMMRTVTVTNEYCLDVFQMASERPHTYDWLAHPRADGPARGPDGFAPIQLPARPPYSVLKDAAAVEVPNGQAEVAWEQGDAGLVMSACAFDERGERLPARLVRALWPVCGDWSEGGRELFMLQVEARRADFVALYALTTAENRWGASSFKHVFNGEYTELRVGLTSRETERRYVLRGI